MTRWDSIDALESLAGEDWRQAVVDAEEEHMLTEVFCDHYEAIQTVELRAADRVREDKRRAHRYQVRRRALTCGRSPFGGYHWRDSERVLAGVDEPRRPREPGVGDAVDGLQSGHVVVLGGFWFAREAILLLYMSAPLVRLVTPDLPLLDAAIDDPSALDLGEVPDDEVGKASRHRLDRTPSTLAAPLATWPRRRTPSPAAVLVQMAKSGELKMAARRDKASCVSAPRTIVRLPTAGR